MASAQPKHLLRCTDRRAIELLPAAPLSRLCHSPPEDGVMTLAKLLAGLSGKRRAAKFAEILLYRFFAEARTARRLCRPRRAKR